MSIVFLDTNALLKLYVSEKGSRWLHNFVSQHHITISELALFESAVALRRRYTEGSFTKPEAIDLFGQIVRQSVNYEVVALGGPFQLNHLTNLIFNVSSTLRIRSLDSIHLTAASTTFEKATTLNPPEPFVFVSSDRQLLQVAQAEGFMTENPEDYP